MGRLVTGVREAEERLAAIARALQTVYDEEVREATQARDAAARSLVRAEAMEEAARALGTPEVVARLAEVIQQLRATHSAAVSRLQELSGIEKSINLRLGDGETSPGPALPSRPPPSPAPAEEPAREDALGASTRNLLGRIDEVERLVPKWPRELATITVQEHVALVRVLMGKLTAAGRSTAEMVNALHRLDMVAGTTQLDGIVGLSSDTGADWNKLATEMRARRLALADARKKTLSRPG